MVIHEMYPRMKAVKLEPDVCQEVFVGKLIVKFVLILHTIPFDFLLGVYLRKLPIDDSAFTLIS